MNKVTVVKEGVEEKLVTWQDLKDGELAEVMEGISVGKIVQKVWVDPVPNLHDTSLVEVGGGDSFGTYFNSKLRRLPKGSVVTIVVGE